MHILWYEKAAEKLGDKIVSGMEETARTGGNAVAGLANWILDHPGSSMLYAAIGIVIIASREHNRDAYNFIKNVRYKLIFIINLFRMICNRLY